MNFQERPAALRIEADGDWRVVVQPLSEVSPWPGTPSGTGAAVLRLSQGPVSDLTVLMMTHHGESNFTVTAYGQETDLLVNEIGNYTGEVQLPLGTTVLEIEADGTWTLDEV